MIMSKPPFALVADQGERFDRLRHFTTYLRLLDADAEGTDWA